MDEHVLSAIGRLDEAEALLGIEKLDCTLCHIWPPVKTPIGVHEPHDIVQPCVRIQRCLGKSPDGQISRTGKTSNTRYIRQYSQEINRCPVVLRRIQPQWHSSLITEEIAPNEIG